MAKEEHNLFDPIIPDFFYSSHHQPFTSSSSCRNLNKTMNPNSSSSSSSAAAAALISFENSKYTAESKPFNLENYSSTPEIIRFSSSAGDESEYDDSIRRKRVSNASRSPLQAQEHVMAERRRRENLTQLFINLSKLVPGLKKLDKASVLEDGINHLKELQERVRVLEEEEMTKKSSVDAWMEDSRTIINNNEIMKATSPEIQVRIWNKHVLIKIFCKKHKGLMSIIPSEMEKIDLNVIDMRMMPFGEAALDITILAQSKFECSVEDIIDYLRSPGLLEPA